MTADQPDQDNQPIRCTECQTAEGHATDCAYASTDHQMGPRIPHFWRHGSVG
jgi:hypothetical protein